jgi:hypothetical protein
LALTHVLFIPSRLNALSTLSKHLGLTVVVDILLFFVDVIRSLAPEFNIMFGGRVKSFAESFLPSMLSSLLSDSGGDGLFIVIGGGDK